MTDRVTIGLMWVGKFTDSGQMYEYISTTFDNIDQAIGALKIVKSSGLEVDVHEMSVGKEDVYNSFMDEDPVEVLEAIKLD